MNPGGKNSQRREIASASSLTDYWIFSKSLTSSLSAYSTHISDS